MKRIITFLALLLCCAPCGAQQEIYSGVSDQYVYFKMVDATDHVTAETGLSSFTVERSRNGATGTAWTTPTVVEIDATNAPGVYALLFDEDTTITSGDISQNMVLGIAATGCAPTALSVILKRPAVTAGETLTVSSGAIPWSAAWDAEVQSECVDAIASLFQLAGGTVEANVTQVSGDPNAADNAELFFDGTGYAGGTTKLVVEAESSTVTADRVSKQVTFNVGSEGTESRNIVKLNAWSTGTRTLGFDFSELLKQMDTTLSTVDTVTVVQLDGSPNITTSSLRKHQNGMVALWNTAAITTANAGTYVVTVTVTTTDSNTIVVTGTLEVE